MRFEWLFSRPPHAIRRRQGVHGHPEMAFAFRSARFCATDLHMLNTLESGLRIGYIVSFFVEAAPQRRDWRYSSMGRVLPHERCRPKDLTSDFFGGPITVSLGTCNGCQMLTRAGNLVPGGSGVACGGCEDEPAIKGAESDTRSFTKLRNLSRYSYG